MYEEYWGLKEKPFLNTPDPRFLYYSAQHEEAQSRLIYTIRERIGAAMLTGVFGCGKTLIAQAMLNELKAVQYKTAYIVNPRLNDVELLRMIAHKLGEEKAPQSKTDVLNIIQDMLLDNARNGKDIVVIIDEAHAIEDEATFEELRLLLNFQLKDRFLLTLILLGQPELKQKIDKNIQFEQRINIKCHLGSLDAEDVKRYIVHRLGVAKRTEPLFTEHALDSVASYSGGIPRRINRLCDLCLLAGFIKKAGNVDEEIVQNEIKELE